MAELSEETFSAVLLLAVFLVKSIDMVERLPHYLNIPSLFA